MNNGKESLSEKELKKGFSTFQQISDESSKKLENLESELIKEVREKGNSNYASNLSWSIQTEAQHIKNFKKEMEMYKQRLITAYGLSSVVGLDIPERHYYGILRDKNFLDKK